MSSTLAAEQYLIRIQEMRRAVAIDVPRDRAARRSVARRGDVIVPERAVDVAANEALGSPRDGTWQV